MMESLIALFCGALFAVGLAVSGMTQPGKVTGFLDFFGNWDPSLAFVMGGAIFIYSIGFRLVTKRKAPLANQSFQIPASRKIDKPVIIGSALFGIGWGIAGFCPGPALVSLSTGRIDVAVFVAAMILGMVCFKAISKRARI